MLKKEGKLNFAVVMTSPKYIDKKGITRAIAVAMARAIERLALDPDTTYVKLDGALKAPAGFQQETIIKGDQKELVIGLASILAKETRDRYMVRIASRFAPYGFHLHKGYGTLAHRTAIKQHGLSVIHRATYCKNCFL
ncbi:MAG: ribonuclease HII [Patescibacteria group bacterium]